MDTYAQIIRHVICNYISSPRNYTKIKEHLPSISTSGQDYVLNLNMWSLYCWGTDTEVLVFSQLTGHDVYVYSQHKHWVR